MRRSSFQSIDVSLSRDVQSEYDNIRIVADNIAAVLAAAGIAVDIQAVAGDSVAIDSLYADKATLDSIFADKSKLDSIFADKSKLDSLYADKATLDRLFASIANIDAVAGSIGNVDIVAGDLANVDAVGANLALGVTSDILNAEANGALALSSLDDFKGRYFQGQASDPTVDLNGNALNEGDMYFNTTVKEMRVYDGSVWKTSTDSYTKTEVDSGQLDNRYYTETEINTTNTFRADRFLAAQNIAGMVYDGAGNLIKIQYNNATDVDYEVLSYSGGDLSNVAHYVSGVLAGNTVLSYTNAVLTSAVFTGV